ncbi:SMP-30/gluconolactonase/LRE family protein [Nonomuraea purpurea]|uniref:SMP-30/gluconolactonase/LRE family protein n=1 Tax=Nonomuraea purpurea TaxID=1849276 RepID=A0ABV8GE11_9ACTN
MSVAVAVAALATFVTAPPAQASPRVSTAFELPGDRVYPEGITADPRGGALYAASYADGTVFKMTPGRRVAEIFLPAGADGRHTANGLEVDQAGRLWVIDSTRGVCVYDTRDRELLARFDLPAGDGTFANDVAIGRDGSAYLTDSLRAVVYRVTPAQLKAGSGTLRPFADLAGLRDPGAPESMALNGIAADPSGRFLLTADMTGGGLYRIDPATAAVRRVALRGGDVRQADGLEMWQGTLWVVHNTANAISRWRVSEDGSSARMERRLTDPALQLPTTLVRDRGSLYVVRSQFDKGGPLGPGTPEIPFTVASVRGI